MSRLLIDQIAGVDSCNLPFNEWPSHDDDEDDDDDAGDEDDDDDDDDDD